MQKDQAQREKLQIKKSKIQNILTENENCNNEFRRCIAMAKDAFQKIERVLKDIKKMSLK